MAWGVRGRIQEIKKSLAPRRFQNVSKPSLHYGKKKKNTNIIIMWDVFEADPVRIRLDLFFMVVTSCKMDQ